MAAKHWFVIWWATVTIPAECPDFKPDEYTGQLPSTHCLVYHCKEVVQKHIRQFETQAEAKAFQEKAPQAVQPNMLVEYCSKRDANRKFPASPVPATLPVGGTGTGVTSYTGGDIVGDVNNGPLHKLAIPSGGGQLLHVDSNGTPEWKTITP